MPKYNRSAHGLPILFLPQLSNLKLTDHVTLCI